MAERLYELARAEAGLTGGETVYDLYCGIGTIGLSLARDALTVWGIEISEESVACAIENAELNAIGNAAFFAGNVGQVLRDLRERAGEPDVVVVDPPRAGLAGKALKRLGELAAPRVVYVSCNPTTLAGDTKRLRRGVRLPARADAAGRHVPAHAARRVRLAARARADGKRGTRLQPGRLSAAARQRQSRRQSRSSVREQEAERDPRQRGQAAGRPRRSSARSSTPRPERHARARSRNGAEAEARRSRARKTAKNSTSGSPSRAAFPPGTTNATESVVNTSAWCSVIVFVGPRQTE